MMMCRLSTWKMIIRPLQNIVCLLYLLSCLNQMWCIRDITFAIKLESLCDMFSSLIIFDMVITEYVMVCKNNICWCIWHTGATSTRACYSNNVDQQGSLAVHCWCLMFAPRGCWACSLMWYSHSSWWRRLSNGLTKTRIVFECRCTCMLLEIFVE